MPAETFAQVISAAIAHFAERGYTSAEDLDMWLSRIRTAAERDAIPSHQVETNLRASLEAIYKREIERGGFRRFHPGIGRFTLDRVKPKLRAELDRRIRASASLIKLNRVEAVDTTLRRFAGWVSTIPLGGSRAVERRAERRLLRKELASLPFIERRVAIDQGTKFAAALSDILAKDGGALAFRWHQNFTQHPRSTHRERDGKIYLIRSSWAHKAGLVKPGKVGYSDEITKPGEEVYCRCTAEYLYALRDLPDDMITRHGHAELARVRAITAA